MENTSKKMMFDYKNHDELVDQLKLKEDNESKLVVKSYQNMNKSWIIGFIIFIVFAVIETIIKEQLEDVIYIAFSVVIAITIVVGTFLGREYRQYITKNNIKVLEDALYYYSK